MFGLQIGAVSNNLGWGCGTGERQLAVEAYKKVEEKAAGSGLKMDNVFNMLRYTGLVGMNVCQRDMIYTK